MECAKCGIVLIEELMDGESFGRPKAVFCLDCHGSLEDAANDHEEDLEESVTNPAREHGVKRYA